MPDLWTPPRGFFSAAQSWFHAGNMARCQPLFRSDINCQFAVSPYRIVDLSPPCDGSATGLPVHLWRGSPPSKEGWGLITGCQGDDYLVSGFPWNPESNLYATIGTGVPATLADLWHAFNDSTFINPAQAIRYSWLFTNAPISFWQFGIPIIHWLPPP